MRIRSMPIVAVLAAGTGLFGCAPTAHVRPDAVVLVTGLT